LGCQYSKSGVCKRFAPALEATGIDVIKLAQEVMDLCISWRQPKQPMPNMIALGGIYTNETIPPSKFKEVIENVCNNK
jgi:hypothetical protein